MKRLDIFKIGTAAIEQSDVLLLLKVVEVVEKREEEITVSLFLFLLIVEEEDDEKKDFPEINKETPRQEDDEVTGSCRRNI